MFPFRTNSPRRWLALSVFVLLPWRLIAADAEPASPELPVEPPAPAAPAAPRPVFRSENIVGIFQDVHQRADEVVDQVVAIFGNARVEGRVTDSVVTVFGSSTITAEVNGNVVAVFGNTDISQDVEGDAVCIFGVITLGHDVTVHGDLVSVGGTAEIDSTARVRGQTVPIPLPGMRHFGDWVREDMLKGRLYAHDQRSTWIFIGVMLVLSLLAAAIFRGPVEAGVGVLSRRSGAAFVNGILGAIIVPPAMFLLVATGIGALVVPFAWLGVMFATMIGVIALHRFIGAQLGAGASPLVALAVGHVLFAALYMLPVVGLLAWLTVMMFGFGVALTAWGETRRERRAQEAAARKAATPPAPVAPVTAAVTPPHVAATVPPVPGSSAGFQAQSSTPPAMPAEVKQEPSPSAPLEPPPAAPASAASPPEVATPPPVTPPPISASAPTRAAVPAPGVPLPAEPADFWPRIAATLLDLIMVVVAVNVLSPLDDYFVTAWFVYHIAFWAWRGTTLGGAVMNLRIQRLDGRPVDVGVALVRALGAVMSFLPFCLGFLWMNWDPEKQTWHDKIAGTVIVRLPRGQALI